jgi:signal transduction histidine kinase
VTATRVRIPVDTEDTAIRELIAVREIVHAFLTADRAEEVFQFALERVSPLVGASFASVYLIERGEEVMRLTAAYNWPERFRPFLGEMRVRLGRGPSGEAASERHVVQVPDVFADKSLADWQDVASEMGFRAIIALPLQTRTGVLGAVAFYFAESDGFDRAERGLLRTVADQMAATAEKASLIEELRRANAALVESNAELERQYVAALEARRIKDEFLANMSHELRTPLTAVLGYTYLIQEGLAGPLTEEQRTTLAQVTSSSERLLTLIDDLLDLTTLKRGEVTLHVDTFDAHGALSEAIASAKGRQKGVALHIEPPPETPLQMHSDRRKVVRILANLLSNAFKFTPRGEIRTSVALRDGLVRFVVEDTGIGIASDAQDVIFDEFRQVDGSVTRRYGGSGLGLALSRRLARLLGGDITLRSAPNEGATFVVELPVEYGVEQKGT